MILFRMDHYSSLRIFPIRHSSSVLLVYTFTGEMLNQPLPHPLSHFLIWFIPITEIGMCLALLFERTRLLVFMLLLAYQQYYLVAGRGYMPTGTWAVNYLCDFSTNVCTYTMDGFGNYFPCRTGDYRLLPGITRTQAAKKK